MKNRCALFVAAGMYLFLASTAAADTAKGQGIYMNFCAPCHDSGAAGAPKVGDKQTWQDRSSKGTAAVVANAVKGYQGKSGFMPAKGGNSALTDEEVSFAVMYMLEQSQ